MGYRFFGLRSEIGKGLLSVAPPPGSRQTLSDEKCVASKGSFSCKSNSFSYERFCARPRFE